MNQAIRHPKSQVRIGIKNLDADKAAVENILLEAHGKFGLYDNSATSRVPQTIRSIVEKNGSGFGLGARVVGEAIYVDFLPHKSKSPKFDEVHEFILGELRNVFHIELVEIREDNPLYFDTIQK